MQIRVFAFTDIYLQPIQLGWHTKSADFTVDYGMFIPTGKYTLGGENSGLGMFINEFSARRFGKNYLQAG
ncbi:transporter [Solitalea canadensis]|uniref:transporter n=1 Tax=Solitalea canadensis TaxID=995 RepID=UPI000FB701FC